MSTPIHKLHDDEMLRSCQGYVKAGFVLVPIGLDEKGNPTKGPRGKSWQLRKNCVDTTEACLQIRHNVGLVHTYSRTCSVDLDDVSKARVWLLDHGIELDDLWNNPAAVRIISGVSNRGKLLFKLPPGVQPLRTWQIHEAGLELRCATGNGTSVQDVLPPSIHPTTREPYRWEYADDMLGHWSTLPELPEALFKVWQEGRPQRDVAQSYEIPEGNATLMAISRLLDVSDPSAKRPEWFDLMCAVHQGCNGSDEGFELFNAWSSTGSNYDSRDKCLSVWMSLGTYVGPVITFEGYCSRAGVSTATPEDFEDLGELPEDEKALSDAVKKQNDANDPNRVVYHKDLAARPAPTWFVDGVIPSADLGVIVGASGSGKSFLMLDLMAAIQRGLPWCGKETKQAQVVICVAEGEDDFILRMNAYAAHHEIPDTGLALILNAPNLSQTEDINSIIKNIKRVPGVGIVVFDTLAQTIGADESSAKDMSKLIANARRIKRETGAMVIFVHHTGKDVTRGGRGSSALYSGADMEMTVASKDNQHTAQITKMKGGGSGSIYGFTLSTIELQTGGKPLSSLVVEMDTGLEIKTATRLKAKKPNEVAIISVLKDVVGGLAHGELVQQLIPHMKFNPDEGRDRRRDYALTAVKRALSNNILTEAEGKLILNNV